MIIFSYRYPFDLWHYVFRIAVRDKRVRAFSAEERALCEKEYLALESECKETAATIQNLEADLEAAVAAASADGPWNWLSSYFSQMTIVCKSNGKLYQTDCHVLLWKKRFDASAWFIGFPVVFTLWSFDDFGWDYADLLKDGFVSKQLNLFWDIVLDRCMHCLRY